MTPEEARALGGRYLAAGGKWRNGMVIRWRDRGWECDRERLDHVPTRRPIDGGGWWPDFRDEATLGCLVAEVRERRGEPFASVYWDHVARAWACADRPTLLPVTVVAWGPTEPEAWIAALEAAP